MTDPSAPVPVVPPPSPPAAEAPAAAQAPAGSPLRQLLVSLAWEALLFIAAIIAVAVVFLGDPSPTFDLFLSLLTPIGLLAVAVSLSLRTASVNLAVGALAILAATIGVSLSNDDVALPLAMAIGVIVATAAGLVLGVIAAALSVPAWAVTLGGVLIIEAAVIGGTGGQITPLRAVVGPPSGPWFLLFVLLTLGGAALWLVPAVRTALSAARDVAPAGRWGGLRPGLGTVVGLTGSAFLAGLAGVAYALRLHAAPTPNSSSLTLIGLAVALLGGVSIFGRRGGLAGVFLATVLLVSLQHILLVNQFDSWVVMLVNGIAVIIGLTASRLIETISGPDSVTR